MKKKARTEPNLSTEEKIIEAARKVFTKKGYSATRTRDIAEEAGINLALLNYYFRSKQKLFEQVMAEKMHQFFGTIAPVLMDSTTKLEDKITLIVTRYIDMITENPDLPIFVLNEIKNNSARLADRMHIDRIIMSSSLVQQLKERRPEIHPLHFLVNILGMTIFPFIARPVFDVIDALNEREFKTLMEERKKLIPTWVKGMLRAK